MNSKNSGSIFVFHDIVSDECPGVVQFWNELKANGGNIYTFFEFVDCLESHTSKFFRNWGSNKKIKYINAIKK